MKEDNNRSAITKKIKNRDFDLLSGDTLFIHYDAPGKREEEGERMIISINRNQTHDSNLFLYNQ